MAEDPFMLAELALEMTAGMVLQWRVSGRSMDEADIAPWIERNFRLYLNGATPR